MGLSVAFVQEDFYRESPDNNERQKKQSRRDTRVQVWIARQYEKDYQEAIKYNMGDILMIQKTMPGWMPTKEV